MNPTLSVVIPVYNVEKYLAQCIDSVLTQDYKDIEIVLVDDGSPDGSGDICDDYAKNHDFIKVVHKSNGGSSDARNIGIQNATGEFITFLDSDDYWNSQVSLAKIMNNVIDNNKIDVFVLGSMGVYPDGKKVYRAYRKELADLKDKSVEKYYKKCTELSDLFEAAYIKLIKRSTIIANSLYFTKGIVAEDNEWSFRLLRCIRTIQFIDETLVVYRANREGSITSQAGLRHIRDMMKIIEMSESYYKKNPNEIQRIGKYELAHCAYLWFISLGIYGNITKEDKKEAESVLKKNQNIMSYSASSKTILCSQLCNVLGFETTSRVLSVYIWLMKNNIISNKKKVK